MPCSACFKIKRIPLKIKWAFQRMRRGYSDQDAWSFDYYFAKMMSDVLGKHITNANSYPTNFNNLEDWKNVLRKMRYGFDMYVYSEDGLWMQELTEEAVSDILRNTDVAVKESLKLLSEHFGGLWY